MRLSAAVWALAVLAPLASGAVLTAEQGAGPGYKGRDMPFFLAPLEGQNVSFAGGARGWLMVPNRSNGTGAVCAAAWQNPPLAARVVCRALGWRGVARAAGAPAPPNASTIGEGGVAWSYLRCNGTEPGPLACDFTPVEANFTGCLPRARLVVECYQDPGKEGELRLSAPPPAASQVSEWYERGLTPEIFHDDFWGALGSPTAARDAVVLCRQAGYASGTAGAGDAAQGLGYKDAGGAPSLSFLACNGTEGSARECEHTWAPPLPYRNYFDWVQRMSISYFTGPLLPLLYCPPAFNGTGPGGAEEEAEDGDVRLADGGETAQPDADGCLRGDAQVLAGGYWGAVAVSQFGLGEGETMREVAQAGAEVVCRQLGAPSANVTGRPYAAVPEVRLPLWLRDLECGGDEPSVLDCGFTSAVLPGGAAPDETQSPFALRVSCCPE